MYTIHLKDIILYSRHGVYEEELAVDAPFQISVACTLQSNVIIKELKDTVNYETILDTVKAVFAQPYALLEVLASDLAERIKYQNPVIARVSIHIYKLNPLIQGIQGAVGVSLEV